MPDQKLYNKAVVIGSGFAGLLAARVLSDYYTHVVIVEKDDEPTNSQTRKGAPQGSHIHVLLNAGEQIMEDLFPGIKSDMLDAGSKTAILGKDVRWRIAGKWLPTFENGMTSFFQTRPMLELVLRKRVSKIENISFRYGLSRSQYIPSGNGKKLMSARLADIRSGQESEEKADLFVEASGASTDILSLLTALNYPLPRESVVEPDFAYSSGLFKIPDNWEGPWKCVLIYPKAPEETRAGAFVPVEDGNWVVTAAGYGGDYPPTDIQGFLKFMKSLPEPEVFNAVSSATQIGKLKSFKFKRGVRRHFEELQSFPENLIVLGDLICRANPFFGQGIAVAALEAQALQGSLDQIKRMGSDNSESLARRFFPQVAKILDVSWGMAVGEDFKYKSTKGKRPLGFPVTRRFKDRVMATNDPEVAKQFYRVMHFVDKPAKLLAPEILRRIFLKR